jgi:hypothetical protein
MDGREEEGLELCGWRWCGEWVRRREGEAEQSGGRVKVVEGDLRTKQSQVDVECQHKEGRRGEEGDGWVDK